MVSRKIATNDRNRSHFPPHSHSPRCTSLDCRRLHDHLHGPRQHRVRSARDPKRHGLFDDHNWLDLRLFSLGICFLSNSGGMVRRSNRRTARPRLGRGVVVNLYIADCLCLECSFHGNIPVLLWSGRGRSIPHRHPLAFSVDAADRTRFRPGHYARSIKVGRGSDPGFGRDDDDPVRMAHALFRFRTDWTWLGRGLVLVLSRQSATTFSD